MSPCLYFHCCVFTSLNAGSQLDVIKMTKSVTSLLFAVLKPRVARFILSCPLGIFLSPVKEFVKSGKIAMSQLFYSELF